MARMGQSRADWSRTCHSPNPRNFSSYVHLPVAVGNHLLGVKNLISINWLWAVSMMLHFEL